MSIGVRIGAKIGPRIGLALGIANDPIDGGGSGATTTLTLGITDSADPVLTQANLQYSAVVTNTGALTATLLSVAITLDSSLTFASASGTGWSCSASGQVVMCTRSSLAVGAAPTITISCTTGTSGSTAHTTGTVSASNASTASGSQDTTVDFVTKDATAGLYLPASATEATALAACKSLTFAPISIWNLQDASIGAADANGNHALASVGTVSFAQTSAAFTRKVMTWTAGINGLRFASSSTDLDPSAHSILLMLLVDPTAGATRSIICGSDSAAGTELRFSLNSGGTLPVVKDLAAAINGASDMTTGTNYHLCTLQFDRTNGKVVIYNNTEKVTGTYGAGVVAGNLGFGNSVVNACAASAAWACAIQGSGAEITSTQLKAIYQGIGISPGWS